MKRLAITLSSLLMVFVLTAQTKEITILSVNDIHSAIEQFPKFAAIVDSIRAEHPDALLFSGGDNRTGNPINDIYDTPNLPIISLMNKVGFNLSTIGNHEFDGKIDNLRYTINESNFPYICANIYANDTLRLHIPPYKIFNINGIKIGILGLIAINDSGIPDTNPGNVAGISFKKPANVVHEYEWLRKQCDVMILLTHNGYEDDIELSKVFPEADIIIGGHSHTSVEGTKIHNGVMITQAERWLKYITEVKIKVENGKVISKEAHLINVKSTKNVNSSVQAMVDEFSKNETLSQVLTQVNEFTCKEELGCLMADAFIAGSNADIGVQNSGGVRRDTHSKGDFTVNDVYCLDPFGNELVVYNLTGEEVVRLLSAASHIDDYGPAYVGGITYEIKIGKDKNDVKELIIKNLDGTKFDLKRTYKVAMNSYLASVCEYEKQDEGKNLFIPCNEELIKFLKTKPYFDYKGVKRVTIK